MESRKTSIAVEDRFKVVPFEEFCEIAHVGHSRGYELSSTACTSNAGSAVALLTPILHGQTHGGIAQGVQIPAGRGPSGSPIKRNDASRATVQALAELDASFFRVRFDQLTPSEKRYLRAMADLGPGPHRSGNIADRLGRGVTAVAPIRNTLIAKGMIYSPAHGDTAFTVPLFDGFMKRTMPDWS